MASVSGSQLSFFAPGKSVNVVLTPDGSGTLTTVAGAFNLEVFTAKAGGLAPGFDGSAFIQGAVKVAGNAVQAGTPGSTEQLLTGSFTLTDSSGNETIQMVGSGAGGDTQTVIASTGDTILLSTVAAGAGTTGVIDLSGTNPASHPGPMTVVGGVGIGATSVWAGSGDSITGGAGALNVAGNGGNNLTIVGGSGDLKAYNFGQGNTVSGVSSGSATTFIDDGYPGGGKSSITGGAGTLTFLKGGIGDTITGGSGHLTNIDGSLGSESITGGVGFSSFIQGGVNDTIAAGTGNAVIVDGTAGKQTIAGGDNPSGGTNQTQVWGGANDSITGGTGSLNYAGNAANNVTLAAGAGDLFAYNLGTGTKVTGSTAGTTFIDDSYGQGGGDTLIGGAGSSTVIAGSGDAITAGTGAIEARVKSNLAGNETVDLTASAGVDGVRDISIAGGTGTKATVTGFGATDNIESATSVVVGGGTGPGALTGSATAILVGSDTVITFNDGSTMTVIGVNPNNIHFTQ